MTGGWRHWRTTIDVGERPAEIVAVTPDSTKRMSTVAAAVRHAGSSYHPPVVSLTPSRYSRIAPISDFPSTDLSNIERSEVDDSLSYFE